MKAHNPVLQSEAAECGLACLAMVASAHGLHIDISELRRRFPLSLKGARLNQLIDSAQKLGFSTRPLRLELEELHKLSAPCILHWDMNHFVVLVSATARKVVIHDPAVGKRVLRPSEVSEHFTGVALELTPAADFTPRAPVPAVTTRQLTGHIVGLWPSLAQILVLSLALQLFTLIVPFYMQWVVDYVLVSADRDMLTVLGIGFSLVLLLQIAISLLRGWSVVFLASRLGVQWMGNVFAHTLRLPLDFFEKRHLGDVTSRMASVQAIQRTLTTSFVEAIIDGLMAVVTLAMMLFYSYKLALVTLLAVALYAVIRWVAYRPVRDRTEQYMVAGAKQQSHLLESLRGMQSVKVAGKEFQRRSVYDNLLMSTVNHETMLARIGLGFNSTSQLVFGAERIAVIWIGAILALDSIFSVGMLIAYLAYKDQFAGRMSSLIDKWVEFRMLRLHGERLADIVLTRPEEAGPHVDMPAPESTEIVVEGLSFRYADGEPWIIRDCSFKIAAGESVAIVGASGCGKTTLVKLMLGLLKPTSGLIRIGGVEPKAAGATAVRSVVGAVMQDDQLFAGSIADNIGFFDSPLDFARVEAAARAAAIHDEIAAMPMGYHSLIGDMGSSLSGGQRQRLILARALYRNPKLLFLDEATSHLDLVKERLVNEAVQQLALTKVIVAHRPETVASADRVLLMDAGKIVKEFRPRELAAAQAAAGAVAP